MTTAILSSQADAKAADKDKLSSLPVELKTQILSYLPVGTMENCRHLSRHFKEIIEEPKNGTALYQLTIDHSYACLQRDATELFEYTLDDP